MVEIRLFGTFDIRIDGKPIALPSRLAQSLFAYLILNPGTAHRREKLAGMFWPDSGEERARSSLRHELWRIRKALGPPYEGRCLDANELTVTFKQCSQCEADVWRLQRIDEASAVEDLQQALESCRGELLPGFYEDWVPSEREHLGLLLEKHIARLVSRLEGAKRWPEVIEWTERWLASSGRPEAAYRALMRAHAAEGDQAKARETYTRALHELAELGLEPSPELRELAAAMSGRTAQAQIVNSDEQAASAADRGRPVGTVTFLFTDIEGSTRMAQAHRDAWERMRLRHHAMLRSAIEAHNGYIFEIIGDAFCAAFHQPVDALRAALASQRALRDEAWGPAPVRVRMGIHMGVAEHEGAGYRGYLALSCSARVMSAAHGGQVLLTQAACEVLQNDLPDEINLRDMGEHRLKDLQRPVHLYQLVVSDLPSDFPPVKSLEANPHNLPIQLTSFIGREAELREVRSLLQRNRLVTLTGVGGTGKTRLALQVAAELVHEFRDGAWFIELIPVSDPTLVPNMVAATLTVREQPGRTMLAVLKDQLADREMLLILDNCEHLVESSAALVDELLRAAPRLRFLVTSREALRLDGEVTYPLQSLALPGPASDSLDRTSKCDAIRLFVERTEAVLPGFHLTDQNVATVAQICKRLDGIPLALELAAARARGLTIDQIATRLDDRFQLLTAGSRTAWPRHQTLRAAIDWSCDLLSEPEKKVLRRLGVFASGWTLEAAQHVTSGVDVPTEDVPDLLSSLVEKSLISVDPRSSRYHMLETLRAYTLARLHDAGEEFTMRTRHLDYFVALGEALEPSFAYSESGELQLAAEHDNILAAIHWGNKSEGGTQKALQLIGVMRLNWLLLYQATPGYELARHFLNLPDGAPRTAARRRALLTLAMLGFFMGRARELEPAIAESVEIAREIGDRRGEAQGLAWHAIIKAELGDVQAAARLNTQALALAKELDLPRLVALAQNHAAGLLCEQGDLAGAEKLYHDCALINRKYGLLQDLLISFVNLAQVALQRGNAILCRDRLLEGAALIEEVPYLKASAPLILDLIGAYFAHIQDWPHAAILFGACARGRELDGTMQQDSTYFAPIEREAQAALGEQAYAAALEQGRRLGTSQAFTDAQAWLKQVPAIK